MEITELSEKRIFAEISKEFQEINNKHKNEFNTFDELESTAISVVNKIGKKVLNELKISQFDQPSPKKKNVQNVEKLENL